MSKVETPMLDKMLKVQEESQICGEFLEWLQARYALFKLNVPRENPYFIGSGDYINTEHLLAEFFGIDLAQAEEERLKIIEEQKQHNSYV